MNHFNEYIGNGYNGGGGNGGRNNGGYGNNDGYGNGGNNNGGGNNGGSGNGNGNGGNGGNGSGYSNNCCSGGNKNSKKKKGGGYTNYSLRSVTNVVNYFPGPSRYNLLLDPDLAMGIYSAGTFGNDEQLHGPGTLEQAVPNEAKFQTDRVFAIPDGNPYRNIGVDDRQIAFYQVEQLQNNPLSQYTTNPDGAIPGFECLSEPDNFSTMVNEREDGYKNFFETYLVDPATMEVVDWSSGKNETVIPVYPQYTGNAVNPNGSIVYNLSIDSHENVNPMIALGASTVPQTEANFGGLCYSGSYDPYRNSENTMYERTNIDIGMMNKDSGNMVCMMDRSRTFANPLILNNFS